MRQKYWQILHCLKCCECYVEVVDALGVVNEHKADIGGSRWFELACCNDGPCNQGKTTQSHECHHYVFLGDPATTIGIPEVPIVTHFGKNFSSSNFLFHHFI